MTWGARRLTKYLDHSFVQRHSTSISAVIKAWAAVGLLACATADHAGQGSSVDLEQLARFGTHNFLQLATAKQPATELVATI
jgi:hypothetical protein